MIEFTCSCGKKYRLPDRNAEREVRCNQCEKTLIVPKQSQKEPVVPVGEQPEPAIKQEEVQHVVVPKVDEPTKVPPAPQKQAETPDKKEVEEAVAIAPTESSPFTADDLSLDDQAPPSGRQFLFGVLALLLIALFGIVGVVVGIVIGRFSVETPEPVVETIVEKVVVPTFSAEDWTISDESLSFFEIRTADGAAVNLSLDGNPTAEKTGKQATLDAIADDLDDDRTGKENETHTTSLKIDSESGEELCVVWPKTRNVGLDETGIKELKFCVHFSRTANAAHKPDNKTPELADFRIRIGDAFGDTVFVLTEKERVTLCEKGRNLWYSLTVPIDGDDHWQRTEHGRMVPRTVDFIEFRAKPGGSGVTFWIDNLKIVPTGDREESVVE